MRDEGKEEKEEDILRRLAASSSPSLVSGNAGPIGCIFIILNVLPGNGSGVGEGGAVVVGVGFSSSFSSPSSEVEEERRKHTNYADLYYVVDQDVDIKSHPSSGPKNLRNRPTLNKTPRTRPSRLSRLKNPRTSFRTNHLLRPHPPPLPLPHPLRLLPHRVRTTDSFPESSPARSNHGARTISLVRRRNQCLVTS